VGERALSTRERSSFGSAWTAEALSGFANILAARKRSSAQGVGLRLNTQCRPGVPMNAFLVKLKSGYIPDALSGPKTNLMHEASSRKKAAPLGKFEPMSRTP
jgi:hypothetical protein